MSLVFEMLGQYGLELSDTIPLLEGRNIDMIAEYMSKEGREARNDIKKANRMFKAGNYEQAKQLYTSAKAHIVEIRKNVNKIRTSPGVDLAVSYGLLIAAFLPIINLLITLPILIERMVLARDSYGAIDQYKLSTEYGNTSNVIRNVITVNCRNAEIACEDKIRRCKQGDR